MPHNISFKCKVTIYIVNHNYGSYLEECISSVLNQTFNNYEIIIFDCGSSDNSKDILKKYENRNNINIHFLDNQPLAITNNMAISMSNGEYIMRLDADDYLHENAIGIMTGILDRNSNLGLVFPDYYEIDSEGNIISLISRHNFKKVTLKDQPAHGACTLIRRNILDKVGGYDEEFTCQDGWDLWLKVIDIAEVFNTNLPLFCYRQHGSNLTTNEERLLNTRSKILKKHSLKKGINSDAIAMIPIRGGSKAELDFLMKEVSGKPIIKWVIDSALNAEVIKNVVVSSPDDELLKILKDIYGEKILVVKRANNTSFLHEYLDETIFDIIGKFPEICSKMLAGIIINVQYPFIDHNDLNSSVNSLATFKTDLVIGVRSESRPIYRHSGHSLVSLSNETLVKNEKNEIYIGGGIQAFRLEALEKNGSLSNINKIGHVIISEKSFMRVSSNSIMELIKHYKIKESDT
jgi:glycosyltransferase involved in cell wall biosynthesis